MKLTKKVVLGIKAVTALRTKAGYTKTSDLAKEVGTTVHFLEQIMRNLRASGIVEVKRGPGGGHFLPIDANVTAYDVARAVGKLSEGIDAGDTSATNQLRIAVVTAFQNVAI